MKDQITVREIFDSLGHCETCYSDGIQMRWFLDASGNRVYCPDCAQPAVTANRWRLARIPRAYKDVTLDSLQETSIVKQVKDFLTSEKNILTIISPAGTGKTSIMAALIKHFDEGAYVSYIDMLQQLRNSYNGNNPEHRWQHLLTTPLLAVDNMDKINETEWAWEKTFQLIDTRYMDAVAGLRKTVFALNDHPDDKYPDTISTRIMGTHAFVIDAMSAKSMR